MKWWIAFFYIAGLFWTLPVAAKRKLNEEPKKKSPITSHVPTRLEEIQVAGLPGAQASISPEPSIYAGSGQCQQNKDFSVPGPNGPSLWRAVQSVMDEGIIPPGRNYDLRLKHWPKIIRQDGKLNVQYGTDKDKTSMCSAALATVFMKYLTDLVNEGYLFLSDDQINFINDRSSKAPFMNGLNGNSYAVALLNQSLGGTNISNPKIRDLGQIRQVLSQAKSGDLMQLDRNNGSGHAVIFKEIKDNQVCYWASNKKTKGVSDRCESLDVMSYVTISRPPRQPCKITAHLQTMMGDKRIAAQLDSSDKTIAPNWIVWDQRLESGGPGNPVSPPTSVADIPEGMR